MSKRLSEIGIRSDLKFDTERIKSRTNDILNKDPIEMKIYIRHKKTCITLIAAAITVLCFATAFAADNIISYFQSEKAVEITNIEELENHSKKIESSVSQDGYTLTMNNIAVDDNFMHIFITITSHELKIWENTNIRPFFYCRLNGQIISDENNSSSHGYYVDDYTYRIALKYNISQFDIPEEFMLELYSVPGYEDRGEFEDGYLSQEYLTLTEDDKSKLVYLCVETNKSSIEENESIYETDQTFEYENFDGGIAYGEISKIIFSPFGSQIVIKDNLGGLGAKRVMDMAIADDNGEFVDIITTDIAGAAFDENGHLTKILPETIENDKEYSNSVEFIKGSADTEYLDLIPTNSFSSGKCNVNKPVGSYPITFEVNEYGNIVVTGIVIQDGAINIHYSKDGFVKGNPEFDFLDENDTLIDFGKYPGVFYETNYETNSYTVSYYYNEYDNNGKKPLPTDGSLSKESLETHLSSIIVKAENDYTLAYDDSIRIDLQ